MAVTNIASSLDDQMIRKMVLPKTKLVFERNAGDLKLTLNVLACLDQVIERLDKSAIIDDVLPLLWDVKLQDPEIIQEVVSKFNPTHLLFQQINEMIKLKNMNENLKFG